MKKGTVIAAILMSILLCSSCSSPKQIGRDFVDGLERQWEQTEKGHKRTNGESSGFDLGVVFDTIKGENEEHIIAVKNGASSNYPDITYGEAFNNYFARPSWRYFVGTISGPDEDGDGEPDYTEDNVDVVEFTGECMYSNVQVEAKIQFVLDMEEGTFYAHNLTFNEVPQIGLMLYGLLDDVFSSMEGDGQSSPPPAGPGKNDSDGSVPAGDTPGDYEPSIPPQDNPAEKLSEVYIGNPSACKMSADQALSFGALIEENLWQYSSVMAALFDGGDGIPLLWIARGNNGTWSGDWESGFYYLIETDFHDQIYAYNNGTTEKCPWMTKLLKVGTDGILAQIDLDYWHEFGTNFNLYHLNGGKISDYVLATGSHDPFGKCILNGVTLADGGEPYLSELDLFRMVDPDVEYLLSAETGFSGMLILSGNWIDGETMLDALFDYAADLQST